MNFRLQPCVREDYRRFGFDCLLPRPQEGVFESDCGRDAKWPKGKRSCELILTHTERFSGGRRWSSSNPNGVCAMRDAFSEWTISSDDVDQRIARAIRISVGREIREMYSSVLKEEIPPKIAALLRRLDR
jgi:hypothetical protein